jgi:hypothetical protein
MVVCDLDGVVVGGAFAPSSDTLAHAYVCRHMPDVGAVVHTHSAYATAWAARREAIPCVITAMADEFGGEIPVGPFALIGEEQIGRAIVQTLSGHRSPRGPDGQPRRLHHRPHSLRCSGVPGTTDNDYVIAQDEVSGRWPARLPIDSDCASF